MYPHQLDAGPSCEDSKAVPSPYLSLSHMRFEEQSPAGGRGVRPNPGFLSPPNVSHGSAPRGRDCFAATAAAGDETSRQGRRVASVPAAVPTGRIGLRADDDFIRSGREVEVDSAGLVGADSVGQV